MSQELESIRTEMPGGHTFRYLPVSNINDTGFAEAIFTTREGGVSAGPYRSLDLGWNNDDSRDNIYENYRRVPPPEERTTHSVECWWKE